MSTLQELQNIQFNLKFTGKQFHKSSSKSEKEHKAEKNKCKQAMQKGNMESAKIYAQSAIRKKNEGLNFLRLSARMDTVASRLDTAIKMKTVMHLMCGITKGMDKVLQGMNPERISKIMDTFEKQFETMDVTSEYMQDAIGQTTASSVPEEEVQMLMERVADEHGLDLKEDMRTGKVIGPMPVVQSNQDVDMDELSKRIAGLNSNSNS